MAEVGAELDALYTPADHGQRPDLFPGAIPAAVIHTTQETIRGGQAKGDQPIHLLQEHLHGSCDHTGLVVTWKHHAYFEGLRGPPLVHACCSHWSPLERVALLPVRELTVPVMKIRTPAFPF